MNNLFNECCFSVKAPLHEQAVILKTENDASPFAVRNSDPCLADVPTRLINCWAHNIPWHFSKEVLQLEINLAVSRSWTLSIACC